MKSPNWCNRAPCSNPAKCEWVGSCYRKKIEDAQAYVNGIERHRKKCQEARKAKAEMTPATYQAARKRIGTQTKVAAMLDLDPQTISRRERGELPITREAALAIDALQARQKRPARGKRAAMQAPNNAMSHERSELAP
jgi:DNA-binding XRE family transcriptional regulator